MPLSNEVYLFLEKMNPLLLMIDMEQKEILHEPKDIKIFDDTEVLIVNGIDTIDCKSVLQKGVKVLVIEDNEKKISSFISGKRFFIHKDLYISKSDKQHLFPILKQFAFKKVQYEGELTQVNSYVDGMMMSFSEYRDLGETILPNILGNLLHIHSYIDGRDLIDLLEGEEAIICGNGLSLKNGIEEIKQMAHRPIIFSVGSSLPVLLSVGIIPDFFAVIDPSPPLDIYECLKDLSIPIFYQNRATKDLLYMHKGPKIYMGSSAGWQIEDSLMNEMRRDSFSFDAGCHAGNFGAHVVLSLGCSAITLVGMDGIAKSGEEISLNKEGKSTRSDLYYGMDFFSLLLENFPERTIYHYTEGFTFKGSKLVTSLDVKAKKKEIILPEEKVCDANHVKEVIDRYFDHTMLDSLTEFMKGVKEDTENKDLIAAALLAEFSLEPLFLHFCTPLWEIWKVIIPDSDDVISQLTFYYNLLKKFSEKTGKIGDSFFLLGKKEGEYRRYDKNKTLKEEGYYFNGKADGEIRLYDDKGNVILKQSMKRGLRHGPYQAFKNGSLCREGLFINDTAHGRHLCYKGSVILDDISYDMGKKCGVHRYYSDTGIKLEEIIYKEGDFFDRYKFNNMGEKTYSGVWTKGLFIEKGFEHNIEIFSRSGKMSNGKLVFKEDNELIF